jgi:hypothetical protein
MEKEQVRRRKRLLYKIEQSGNFFPVNGVILLGTVRPGMSGGQ